MTNKIEDFELIFISLFIIVLYITAFYYYLYYQYIIDDKKEINDKIKYIELKINN